jgi:hypothetical protein
MGGTYLIRVAKLNPQEGGTSVANASQSKGVDLNGDGRGAQFQ